MRSWITLATVCAAAVLLFSCSSRDYAYTVEASRDGSFFVAADSLKIYRCDLSGNSSCSLMETGLSQYDCALALSLDGRYLLIGEGKGYRPASAIALWDLAAKKEVRRYAGHTGPVRALAFSGDGRAFYSAGDDGKLYRWNVESGKSEVLYAQDGGGLTDVSLSPDGSFLVTGTVRKIIRLDTKTGDERIIPCSDMDPQTLAISPDGRHIAVGGRYAPTSTTARFDRRDYLWIIDAKSFTRIESCPKIEGTVYLVRFSPDGKALHALAHRWDEGRGRFFYYVTTVEMDGFGVTKRELPGDDVLHRVDFERKTFALAPAGGRAIYQGKARGMRLWNYRTGRVERTYDPWAAVAVKK